MGTVFTSDHDEGGRFFVFQRYHGRSPAQSNRLPGLWSLRSTDADPERFIEPTTACGCIVGIYVTYTAEIVVILDSRDTACASDDHLPGRQIAIDQPRHDRAS